MGHEVTTRHALGGPGRGAARLRFQIETSKNFALRGLTRILCGGLDRHIEHHLFPHLPPDRLQALSPGVRAICAQHGIRYQEFPSFRASLRDSAAYLHSLAAKTHAQGSP